MNKDKLPEELLSGNGEESGLETEMNDRQAGELVEESQGQVEVEPIEELTLEEQLEAMKEKAKEVQEKIIASLNL